MTSAITKKWPIGPLQAYVESRGISIQTSAQEVGRSYAVAVNLADIYRVGVREGFLTLKAMDSICCDALGLHPMQVYGIEEYFNPSYDAVRVTTPCRGCNGPKGPGEAHYCTSCREERAKPRKCKCGCGTDIPKGSKVHYVEYSHAPSYRRDKDKARVQV